MAMLIVVLPGKFTSCIIKKFLRCCSDVYSKINKKTTACCVFQVLVEKVNGLELVLKHINEFTRTQNGHNARLETHNRLN